MWRHRSRDRWIRLPRIPHHRTKLEVDRMLSCWDIIIQICSILDAACCDGNAENVWHENAGLENLGKEKYSTPYVNNFGRSTQRPSKSVRASLAVCTRIKLSRSVADCVGSQAEDGSPEFMRYDRPTLSLRAKFALENWQIGCQISLADSIWTNAEILFLDHQCI